MSGVVALRGSVEYREDGNIVVAWLNDRADLDVVKEAFGGVFSKSRTSKGTLYSLFVPELKLKFLCLCRGE